MRESAIKTGVQPIVLPKNLKPLPRSFYDRPAIEVAEDLLGKLLVHVHEGRRQVGRIVEVEAYLGPHDLAAHSARGRTARTEVMFGPPGHAYVYMIYGIHYCMNVVTEPAGVASAVLLRAIEPLQDIDARTQGPGLLCKAMGIDKRLHGHDMLSEVFFFAELPEPPRIAIARRPRIGVDYARHWARRLLRFYIKGNPWISKP